jgi:hypothetical protein
VFFSKIIEAFRPYCKKIIEKTRSIVKSLSGLLKIKSTEFLGEYNITTIIIPGYMEHNPKKMTKEL